MVVDTYEMNLNVVVVVVIQYYHIGKFENSNCITFITFMKKICYP